MIRKVLAFKQENKFKKVKKNLQSREMKGKKEENPVDENIFEGSIQFRVE